MHSPCYHQRFHDGHLDSGGTSPLLTTPQPVSSAGQYMRSSEGQSARAREAAMTNGGFEALSDSEVLVLGQDGNLWLEHGPFGQQVPPVRQQIDGNVQAFQALSDTEVVVLGQDGNLWLEHGPFG